MYSKVLPESIAKDSRINSIGFAVKAAVRKVAEASVFEARRLNNVQTVKINVGHRWYAVAVPEVMAIRALFKEIIDGVEKGSSPPATEKEQLPSVIVGSFDFIVVAASAEAKVIDCTVYDFGMGE